MCSNVYRSWCDSWGWSAKNRFAFAEFTRLSMIIFCAKMVLAPAHRICVRTQWDGNLIISFSRFFRRLFAGLRPFGCRSTRAHAPRDISDAQLYWHHQSFLLSMLTVVKNSYGVIYYLYSLVFMKICSFHVCLIYYLFTISAILFPARLCDQILGISCWTIDEIKASHGRLERSGVLLFCMPYRARKILILKGAAFTRILC